MTFTAKTTIARHLRAARAPLCDRSAATAHSSSARPPITRDFFAATIGGLGLTGLILWAEIQLMPIRSSMIDVTSVRFANLDEFFLLSERLDPLHEYSVAWVDCQSRGTALGAVSFSRRSRRLEGHSK